MRRIEPTTITRMTESITAYSAMSCPSSSSHNLPRITAIFHLLELLIDEDLRVVTARETRGFSLDEVAGAHPQKCTRSCAFDKSLSSKIDDGMKAGFIKLR